jgi:hypothetical protein
LKAQFGATRDAALRLALAHIDLAKAEAAAIGGQVARAAGLIGGAIVLVLFIVFLVLLGMTLWTAETLLGSMGWGILHGVLMYGGIAVAFVLAAVGMSGRRIGGALLVAILVGVLVSLILALQLPNQLYARIGEALLPNVESGVRPLVVGALIWAVLGALVAIAIGRGAVTSGGGWIGVGLLGILLGALIGAITAITFEVQVAVGLGAAVGWATWSALMLIDISRTGIDTEALKARFTPTMTIETSKETLEWLQSKMPPGTGS